MTTMSNKIIFITGASRGIGKAAALEFAKNGAKVALFGRDKKSLIKVQSEIGESATALQGDVSVFSDVERAVKKTVEIFGRIDVLINNAAAIKPIAYLTEACIEDWDKVIDINIKGVFYGNRCAIPHMLKNKGGTIISVSSGAAFNSIEAWSAYCTSKAGLSMLTACTNLEYGLRGIRTMSLLPGTVATQMQKEIKLSGINPVSKLDWSEHFPPEWPAKALVWMCQSASDRYLGKEVDLREKVIQRAVGLIQ
ncbi:MAG: SDR family oxidoreductase [Pseudomonadota bacterium]|nr:SDR family oxidoreductase [Pseudomonadota bacterium]